MKITNQIAYVNFLCVLLLIIIYGCSSTPETTEPEHTAASYWDKPKKKIFAHYMGCYPLDKFLTMKEYYSKVRHDASDYGSAIGGRHCNLPLQPAQTERKKIKESESLNTNLSQREIEAAALDIRRAIRAGIDGFAVDVLAGRERGIRSLQALFAAAEKYDLPFEITFCLDNPYRNPAAIKLILDNYGNSSALARRKSKPMFFAYYSGRDAMCYIQEYLYREKVGEQVVPEAFKQNTNFKGLPQIPRDTLDFPEIKSLNQLWTTPEGFAAHAKAFRHYEERFETPLFLQYELSDFIRSGRFKGKKGFEQMKTAVGILASGFDALGSFLPTSYLTDEQIIELSEITRSKGCEWGEAMNYQYDNQLWQRYHVGKTNDTLEKRWDMVDKTGSTLLQFTTWNDYAENTHLAPATETRYTYLELNSYFVHKWKTGKFPEYADDRIFAIYHKYPKGAESSCYPFQVARHSNLDKPIEIITILKSPAKVRLKGRNKEWDAPSGYHVHRAPCTPGKVSVEVLRDGHVVKTLDCPEPITDRIYKEQATPTCFSTEFMKNWKLDFGNTEPIALEGWYADKDKDGLPNWFEMYWFGKYGDFNTCTVAEPDGDPDKDGFTNLQEYLNRTNPVISNSTPVKTGFCWDIITDLKPKLTFNPDRDSRDKDVWYYFSGKSESNKLKELKLYSDLNRKPRGTNNWSTAHQFNSYDRNLYPYGTSIIDSSIPGSRIIHNWKKDIHTVILVPTSEHDAILAWKSPITGTVNLTLRYAPTNPRNPAKLHLVDAKGAHHPLEIGTTRLKNLPVKKGDKLFFVAPANADGAGITIDELVVKCKIR